MYFCSNNSICPILSLPILLIPFHNTAEQVTRLAPNMDLAGNGMCKNEGGIRDDRTFNGGMRDKNISVRKGFGNLAGGIRNSLEIDGGMRNQ